MGPLGRRVRSLVRGNIVATGDAAGAPDPITGEGMSLALRSAIRLADAIARGDPRSYAHWRLAQGAAVRGIGRRLLAIAPFSNHVIARLDRRPDFVRRFMRVAAGLDEPDALPLRAWIRLLLP
jgi:flavin-dependent dehydrogenase